MTTSLAVPVLPALGRWLPDEVAQLERLIVLRALIDVGLTETPLGSNRHPVIDAYAEMFGSPLGSSWCALAAGAWFTFAGARVPDHDLGSVAAWYEMAKARGTLVAVPQPGYAIIYGLAGDGKPNHMGVVAAAVPLELTIEGNTTYKRQSGNDRNGEGCTIGDVDRPHVLGYIRPEPAATSLPQAA